MTPKLTKIAPAKLAGGLLEKSTGGGFSRLPSIDSRPASGLWHVVHTLPRQEKALGNSLVAMGIACFIPLVSKVQLYGHRKRKVDLPLFPSYAFLFGSREDSYEAIRTQRVAKLISVNDQAGLEHELAQLDKALAGGATLDPFPYLAVGRRVVVVRGPFLGLEGIIDDRRTIDRLVLKVSLLGRACSLEIDSSLLEVID